MYENCHILIYISIEFVPKGTNNSKPALVETIAWYQRGGKPLSETKLVSFTGTFMCHSSSMRHCRIWMGSTDSIVKFQNGDVPWALKCLKLPFILRFVQHFAPADNKDNI